MPDSNNSPFSNTDILNFADVIRTHKALSIEKRQAINNLSIHFQLKFLNDQKVSYLFKKVLSRENNPIDEKGAEFLGFKSDYGTAFSTAIVATLKTIEGESYVNNNPEGLFIRVLNNKIVDTFRQYKSTIEKARKEAIKQAAKKNLTVNDFYKNHDAFKNIIEIRSRTERSGFRQELFNGATEEQILEIQKSLDQFKNTFNLTTIWTAIQQENNRCFHENKCTHCANSEACLKHLIMISNKQDGIPYNEIEPKMPFRSLRQIISRRYNRIKKNLINLLKK